MAASFPRVGLFAEARAQTSHLLELAADDAACAGADELTLALPLVVAAEPAVAAAGTDYCPLPPPVAHMQQ